MFSLMRWIGLGLLLGLVPCAASWAQNYPSKPISLVMGFAAGSSSDTMTRLIASGMQDDLGKPVVVTNRTGAGGNISLSEVARAAPDGYTLVFIAGHLTSNPFLYPTDFDPIKDFAPIIRVLSYPYTLTVSAGSPVKNLQDLIALGQGGKPIPIGYSGAGGQIHFALLTEATGLTFNQIPYKGENEMVPALLSGQVQAAAFTPGTLLAQVKAGKLRALGVASTQPFSQLPDVPALAKTYPNYISGSWFGYASTGGTPKPIVDRLYKSISAVLQTPKMQQFYETSGFTPESMPPEQLAEHIRREVATNQRIITKYNIKVN